MRWKINLGFLIILIGITNSEVIENPDNIDEYDDGIVESEDQSLPSVPIDLTSETNGDEQPYESPKVDDLNKIYFAEHFDNFDDFKRKWIKSNAKKDNVAEDISKYDGAWEVETYQKQVWKNDLGLVLKSNAKHSAISSKLLKPFKFTDKTFILQYEVTMQNGQECGGSYLKLLSAAKENDDLSKFNNESPYSIMFGPDKCGNEVKLHFIFKHINPINGTITEKHCRKPKERLEEPFKDKLPHLYQLVLNPDNTFQIRVDHRVVNEGSMLNDFTPSVNPPREIDDPNDKKPENWDEREKIPDPDSKKPDDWNEDAPAQIPDPNAIKPEGWLDEEPESIPDPNAKKPEDWDTEIDGEWEPALVDNPICEKAVGCGEWNPPTIANPEYKGKWRAPLIDNPNYQGKWIPKKIPNPDFFEDLHPFKLTAIGAVGIELWSMSNDILFDNIIVTDDIEIANDWAAKTFDLKRKKLDRESKTIWSRLMRHMNYKPGWWFIYFIWVAIPVGFYIRFLVKRAKEETFLNKFIKYSNDNPWLWGLYIVVIGTPLSFAIYSLCCATGAKEKDANASAKKTDEILPDDKELNSNVCSDCLPDDKELNSKDDLNEAKDLDTSPKSKKSDLEVRNNENYVEKIGDNTDNEKSNDEESVGDEKETINSTANEGARKRKPRKE